MKYKIEYRPNEMSEYKYYGYKRRYFWSFWEYIDGSLSHTYTECVEKIKKEKDSKLVYYLDEKDLK